MKLIRHCHTARATRFSTEPYWKRENQVIIIKISDFFVKFETCVETKILFLVYWDVRLWFCLRCIKTLVIKVHAYLFWNMSSVDSISCIENYRDWFDTSRFDTTLCSRVRSFESVFDIPKSYQYPLGSFASLGWRYFELPLAIGCESSHRIQQQINSVRKYDWCSNSVKAHTQSCISRPVLAYQRKLVLKSSIIFRLQFLYSFLGFLW